MYRLIKYKNMKKLILIPFLLLSISIFGQSYKSWSGTYNTQYGDTILVFNDDVSGCGWSVSYSYQDMSDDSTFIVDIGGSGILTDLLTQRYYFTSLKLDSLPYSIDYTTIGDTIKTLWTSEPFPFKQFQQKLTVPDLDSSDIKFVVNFFKL